MRAEDFPLGEWVRHDTARCATCGALVELRRYLQAKPLGTFSLSGSQLKVSAYERWEARCTACGFTGPATPHPNKQERL
jgi:ribosomal protein L37E